MAKRTLPAKEVIAVLVKKFGFRVVSQRGSHIKLRCQSRVTIIPNHRELAFGTLRSVLRLAGITEKNFWREAEDI